jgi:hypothetical protein
MQSITPAWFEERDRLFADTLAFVQQVAENHPDASVDLPVAVVPPAMVAPCELQARPKPRPVVSHAIAQPKPALRPAMGIDDLRRELEQRVASFRDKQQALEEQRQRDYHNAIERIKAITDNWETRQPAPAAFVMDRARETPVELPEVPAAEVPLVPEGIDDGWNRIWMSIVQVAETAPLAGYHAD